MINILVCTYNGLSYVSDDDELLVLPVIECADIDDARNALSRAGLDPFYINVSPVVLGQLHVEYGIRDGLPAHALTRTGKPKFTYSVDYGYSTGGCIYYGSVYLAGARIGRIETRYEISGLRSLTLTDAGMDAVQELWPSLWSHAVIDKLRSLIKSGKVKQV